MIIIIISSSSIKAKVGATQLDPTPSKYSQ